MRGAEMSTMADSHPWRGTDNPFPPVAVARISDLRPSIPTIRTKAVEDIDRLVDDYLAASPGTVGAGAPSGEHPPAAGKVIVIQGNYGVGKTHLAGEVLDRIAQSRYGHASTRVIYHVAPGGSFLTFYTDLMRKAITLDEILGRVLEVYADVVAGAVRDLPFAGELARHLERGDADPQLVIERFGLKEGSLREELRQELSAVTGDGTFARALMLLLQPRLRDATWRWITGDTPEQVLVEQGLTERIQTDATALEALGVVALLYGRRNYRFVLVIDEMEKVVLTWDRSRDASIQAFKMLLEVFHSAGALLVSCGLHDMFEILPRDSGRVDAFISPSRLTYEDVRWYIEETQERAFRERTLQPFTEESVQYLLHLSGGIARDVVRFCYHAYERASATGQEITSATIKKVARDFSPGGTSDMVRDEIAAILEEQAWPLVQNRVLGTTANSIADFWVESSARTGGCAVLLSEEVLDERQAERLDQQRAAIQAAVPGSAVVLVISGYLAAEFRRSLAASFGGESVVVYDPRQFGDEFLGAVNAALSQVSPESAGHPLPDADAPEFSALRAETERIGRQQTSTLRLVRELASQVRAVQAASDERLEGIQRVLEARPGQPAADPAAVAAESLPPELEDLFAVAQRSLAAYGDVRKLMTDTFNSAARQPSPSARMSVTFRLRGSEVFPPIGVAAFLADLLTSFRETISSWLGALATGRDRKMSDLERDRLREICRTYDALYGSTPLFQLDPLPDLTSPPGERGDPSFSGRASRREALEDAFDGLGDRVYKAVIGLADTATRPADPPSQVAN
jgi:hypothetical protein